MLQTLKELLVVAVIAAIVFRMARPLALRFMSPEDFRRRRNTWFAITLTAFLAPNIWVFMFVGAIFLVLLARRDSNPAAVFLMMQHVVPPMSVRVPMVGLSFLANLDYQLLLALCLTLPAALRIMRAGKTGFDRLDFLVLTYLMFTCVFFILPEVSPGILMTPTATDYLRRMVETVLGAFVPYFVISRCGPGARPAIDAMAAYCLACAVLAAIGIFEALRHWLLYAGIMTRLGNATQIYLMRGDTLRAMASTGHSLALGVALAMAFAMWLGLQYGVKENRRKLAVTALLAAGLIAAYSRGPWLASVFAFFMISVLRPRAVSGVFKAGVAFALVASLVAISPLGHKIADVLPFLGGTVDSGNIDYRERLLTRSWEVAQQSPILGDRWALLKLQDMRQGQGIIDLMNGYMAILCGSGYVGFAMYAMILLLGVFRARMFYQRYLKTEPNLAMAGAGVLVTLLTISVLVYSSGRIDTQVILTVGLAAALARSLKTRRAGLPATAPQALPS